MTREIRLSLIARSIPRLIQLLVRCKIFKKKATSCSTTSRGGFVLFCEPCFQTFDVFYKQELGQREEVEGTILDHELEDQTKKTRQQS
jgi:hypothetical protein